MPINWKRPLTSGLQGARDANGRFFSALERRPRMGVGALGAGLVAPLLFENDERGYFQTSLITTPLISAGYIALDRALPARPGLFLLAYANAARAGASPGQPIVSPAPASFRRLKKV